MARIAYLSMDSLVGFECYDSLTFEAVSALGHQVEEVSWRVPRDWDDCDVVVIRSPWDYQDDAPGFMSVLETIERSRATLLNPLSIVRWNIHKGYLRELEQKGVTIVPTAWSGNLTLDELEAAVARFETPEIIVKPAVSANADDTFRIAGGDVSAFYSRHGELFKNRDCLIQPFLQDVIAEGEYSLFYFSGQLRHCILKTPKDDDFRVQEEHGGRLRLIPTPEAALVLAGEAVLKGIGQTLLYGRFDFVRRGGDFLLMEAELIEPSLYFNMDPTAAERFARALDNWLKESTPG